jgi:hypothetical protein
MVWAAPPHASPCKPQLLPIYAGGLSLAGRRRHQSPGPLQLPARSRTRASVAIRLLHVLVLPPVLNDAILIRSLVALRRRRSAG